MTRASNNSHVYRKDLVSIDEEVNMEAYISCKNNNSFKHNLLEILLHKKLKAEPLHKKKVSMVP